MKPVTWPNTKITRDQARFQPWILAETGGGLSSDPLALEILAEGFQDISLREMEAVALQNRIDTKFVLMEAQLLEALASLQKDYRILSVQGRRLNHYRTLYFDTPDFDLYHAHVNGRAEYFKVRSREYTDTCLSYLEVKHKTRKGRTVKNRIATSLPLLQIPPAAEGWFSGIFPYDSRALEPKIWNTFRRITLVNLQHGERVTLDTDLSFYTPKRTVQLAGIAIVEVKKCADQGSSPFLAHMRTRRVQPRGFSKYCTGVSMLYDQVKKNAIKPRMLWIHKLIGETCYE